MTGLALLVLLAATPRAELVNQRFLIPADDWRFVEIEAPKPGFANAVFDTDGGESQARLALMRREDIELLQDNKPYDWLAATSRGRAGALRCYVRDPGVYGILLDNRTGARAVPIQVRVWMDYPQVTRLPRSRQLAVILISFAAFFGIVTWSAQKLLRTVRR